MRAVIQRVSESKVVVYEKTVGEIKRGLMVLLGVEQSDTEKDAEYLAGKIVRLRIFEDADDKMNLSVADVDGSILVVSQFTLLGNCRKGNRPSFMNAAPPEKGNELYEKFCAHVRSQSVPVATGQFRTHMNVHLVNDGPVTIILDSKKAD